MQDAALFHVLLSGVAIYFNLLNGTTRGREAELHTMESVKLLVKRIDEGTEKGISDATMAAVAFMAETEIVLGHYEQWNMHIDGLKAMVQTKGGMGKVNSYLGWKIHRSVISSSDRPTICIHADIIRADLIGCAMFGSMPRFTSADGALGPSGVEPILVLNSNYPQRTLDAIFLTQRLSSDLMSTLKSVHHLTTTVNDAMLNKTHVNINSLGQTVTALRQHLVLDQDHPHNSPIQPALRLGALICLNALIAQRPFTPAPSAILISNLQASLFQTRSSMESCNESLTLMLLYLTFIGGMFLASGKDRTWFIKFAATLAGENKVAPWKVVKEMLVEFWWVECQNAEPARKFWVEVAGYTMGDQNSRRA
jgi:hypothetical protein